jgi:outer membrane protein TolC
LWSVGASLTQTLFDGGRRRATSEAALANYDALRVLAQEATMQQRAVAAAQESLQLATNRYQGGVDTYLQVITAQTFALTNELNAVNILLRRMNASALLIKAIGGDWHVANLPQF